MHTRFSRVPASRAGLADWVDGCGEGLAGIR